MQVSEARTDQEIGWLLWIELLDWLKRECDSPSPELKRIYLKPGSTLTFHARSTTEVQVIYCCDSETYRLRIDFDPDVLYLRYKADEDPFLHELLIKVRDGKARYETRGPYPQTVQQAGTSMLHALLLFK